MCVVWHVGLVVCGVQALGTALYFIDNMLAVRVGIVMTSDALVSGEPSITYSAAASSISSKL